MVSIAVLKFFFFIYYFTDLVFSLCVPVVHSTSLR